MFRQLILEFVISQVGLFFNANPLETDVINEDKKINIENILEYFFCIITILIKVLNILEFIYIAKNKVCLDNV